MAPTIERSLDADDRGHRHLRERWERCALRARRSGVSAATDLVPVGDIRRQRQRRARARVHPHAHDGAAYDRSLAALGTRDRVPGRVHDLLDAHVRDVPAARGRSTRARSGEPPRERSAGLFAVYLGVVAEGAMRLEGEGKLLQLFIGESDRWHGKPLYQAIVERVRQEGLAGATVLRGIEGFGADSRIHTSRILRLSEDLPVVIEIVDTSEQIDRAVPILDEMVGEGMLTLERVQIVSYRSSDE